MLVNQSKDYLSWPLGVPQHMGPDQVPYLEGCHTAKLYMRRAWAGRAQPALGFTRCLACQRDHLLARWHRKWLAGASLITAVYEAGTPWSSPGGHLGVIRHETVTNATGEAIIGCA